MKKASSILMSLLMFCGACGGAEGEGGPEGSEPGTATQEVRGARYCEILLGFQESGGIRIDVYNTFGLNDCPADAWAGVDVAAIQAEHEADQVIPNGPRVWTLDSFERSELLDATVVAFNGIEMRKTGEIDLSITELMTMQSPYATLEVTRNTTYRFEAGKEVYELIDPAGRIFVMQSFDSEAAGVAVDELSTLEERLALPSGWSFRARTLAEDLLVRAVDGVATVVRDDVGSTYQLSQQPAE